jgi:pimeloyl-ACP methyl ester carboxylesterase
VATLSHQVISAPGASPARWLYLLHGIYGSGRNWKTIARKFVHERPEWGAVLVDLRKHGESQDFPPPHTLTAAASDLAALEQATDRPVQGLLAHSFGGKVALVYARDHARELKQVWVVDSAPGARAPGGSAWDMLAVLRKTTGPFESRSAAVAALEDAGVANPVAQWISTNLEQRDVGHGWRFDLDALEALLTDFFRADLWAVVQQPPPGVTLSFVKAESSSVLDAEACRMIEAAGAANGRVFLHRVPGGHWLNSDNPEALVKLLLESD